MASTSGTSAQKMDLSDGGLDCDAEMQKCLEEFVSCQDEIDALSLKGSEAMIEIEEETNKLRKPLCEKRNELIRKIPNFWVTAFANHPQISAILDEEDKECLHFLTKLEVEDYEDIKTGYRIKFHLDENPYFENEVIVQELHLGSSDNKTFESTTIKWKDNMDLVKRHKERETRKKNRGKRPYAETRTFFTWFTDPEDAAAEVIGGVIKDDMWLNPLRYFISSKQEVKKGLEGEDDERQT